MPQLYEIKKKVINKTINKTGFKFSLKTTCKNLKGCQEKMHFHC